MAIGKQFQIMDDDLLTVIHQEDAVEDFVGLQIVERSTGNRMLIQITKSQVRDITDAMLAEPEEEWEKCPACGESGYSDPEECSFCANG